jgi:hypothetical protein
MDTENLISSKVLIVEIKRKIKGLEPFCSRSKGQIVDWGSDARRTAKAVRPVLSYAMCSCSPFSSAGWTLSIMPTSR